MRQIHQSQSNMQVVSEPEYQKLLELHAAVSHNLLLMTEKSSQFMHNKVRVAPGLSYFLLGEKLEKIEPFLRDDSKLKGVLEILESLGMETEAKRVRELLIKFLDEWKITYSLEYGQLTTNPPTLAPCPEEERTKTEEQQVTESFPQQLPGSSPVPYTGGVNWGSLLFGDFF